MATTITVELSAIGAVKAGVWARAQIRELREGRGFGFETATQEQRDEEIAMFEGILKAIDAGWEKL